MANDPKILAKRRLIAAVIKGTVDGVKRAVKDGAEIDPALCSELIDYMVTPVEFDRKDRVKMVWQNGHIDILRYLTDELGPDVRARDDYALREAARCGFGGMVRFFAGKIFEEAKWEKKSTDELEGEANRLGDLVLEYCGCGKPHPDTGNMLAMKLQDKRTARWSTVTSDLLGA